ncbi:hypothetical protein E2320_002589 [Naja naja]|nr:hypothetical protein E2320_002589 [Naja naja]
MCSSGWAGYLAFAKLYTAQDASKTQQACNKMAPFQKTALTYTIKRSDTALEREQALEEEREQALELELELEQEQEQVLELQPELELELEPELELQLLVVLVVALGP